MPPRVTFELPDPSYEKYHWVWESEHAPGAQPPLEHLAGRPAPVLLVPRRSRVRVDAERYDTGDTLTVTEARLTMVAVDAHGRPIPFDSPPSVVAASSPEFSG